MQPPLRHARICVRQTGHLKQLCRLCHEKPKSMKLSDQTLPRKAQDRKESPRSLNMLPRKTSSPPLPPHVPVHVFTGVFLPVQNNSCRFVNLLIHMDTKGDEGSVDEVRTSVGR